MEENTLVVHQPEKDESLRDYLQRYTHEEKQQIYQHKTKSKELCAILVNNRWPREVQEESIEKSLENLWKILERLNNFRRLLHFIELLDPVRRELLDSLNNYGEVIGKISKWCTGGRILASAVDTAGTVGGLYLADAKPGCDNWALGVATFFGLLGTACSVAEIKITYDAFTYLMERIHLDQEYLAPIQSWYQQSFELETEMLNIFPFDMTEKIVKEFTATGEEQLNTANLLLKLLTALANLKIKGAKGSARKDEQESAKKDDQESDKKDEQESAKKDEQESAKKGEQESAKNATESSTDTDDKDCDIEDEQNDDEEILTEKLIRFVLSKQAKELCLSLFVRKQHPLIFDLAKVAALQIKYSSWPFYICQSVAALPPHKRNAYSVPVLGRMGLNLLSIYDGISSIGRSTRHEIEIRQLKKQLECELVALQKIAVFIRLRSRGLILE